MSLIFSPSLFMHTQYIPPHFSVKCFFLVEARDSNRNDLGQKGCPPMSNLQSFDNPQALITGAAQAAGSLTSGKQSNTFHRGLKVWIAISAIGATTNLTVTIRAYDPVTGATLTILASAALTAAGESVLTIYPEIASVANVSASDVLPPTWDVIATVAGSNTATFTIGMSKIV